MEIESQKNIKRVKINDSDPIDSDLVTDAYANIVDRRSFDAWGKLRNLTWKDSEGINNSLYLTQLPFTNKGFTGHENIQEVGLIHMNGRVYDATLARFLSSDPHIQSGALTQSYNRYSYVMNNPLKYTDPSGYFFKKVFRAIKKVVKKAVKVFKEATVKIGQRLLRQIAKVPVLNAIANIAACTFGGPIGCGAFSAASTYAVTGSLSAAFKAGAIAFATARASGYVKANFDTRLTRALAHGAVGGTTSVIQGGKFGQGFGSSFFTKMVSGNIQGYAKGIANGANAVSKIIGAAGAAIVGGTASALGGGKFSNGAQTAAIQYLFNEAGDEDPKSVKFKIGFTKKTGKNTSGTLTVDDSGDISASAEFENSIVSGSANTSGEVEIKASIYDKVKSFVKSLLLIRVNDEGNMEAGYSKGGVGVGVEVEFDPQQAILNTPTGKLFKDPMKRRECAAGLRMKGC